MDRSKKLLLYTAMLLVGLAAFVLEIFVFQKPDGVLGLIICITSIVKLCRLSPKFEDGFLKALDIFFWLP